MFRPTQLETDKERAMSDIVALREEVIIMIMLYPYIMYASRDVPTLGGTNQGCTDAGWY